MASRKVVKPDLGLTCGSFSGISPAFPIDARTGRRAVEPRCVQHHESKMVTDGLPEHPAAAMLDLRQGQQREDDRG